MPEVLTLEPSSVSVHRSVDRVTVSTGLGHYFSRIATPSILQSDGTQGQSQIAAHHHFQVTYQARLFRGGTNSIDELIDFLQARIDADDESFYFYLPTENDDTSTWTGDVSASGTDSRGEAVTNLVGRYLVKSFRPLGWSIRTHKIGDFAELELVQVFS